MSTIGILEAEDKTDVLYARFQSCGIMHDVRIYHNSEIPGTTLSDTSVFKTSLSLYPSAMLQKENRVLTAPNGKKLVSFDRMMETYEFGNTSVSMERKRGWENRVKALHESGSVRIHRFENTLNKNIEYQYAFLLDALETLRFHDLCDRPADPTFYNQFWTCAIPMRNPASAIHY